MFRVITFLTCVAQIILTSVAAEEAATVDFVKDIEPILRSRCWSCHGAKETESGLRLDVRRRALEGSDNGRVIVAGKSADSSLFLRIISEDADERMPPEGKPGLTKSQIELFRRWIDSGAEWPEGRDPVDPRSADHWSWKPVTAPELPSVQGVEWIENNIDLFILRKLETHGLRLSQSAPRSTLIRRAYLDVIGLPPTPSEWASHIEDSSAVWNERMIDRLLASPHYGERQGRFWLDQARYADSDGYEKDRPRKHAYQWRDWVIDALNRDLPFDQFTVQQIAGDLLPGATESVRLATGFHRNTLTNREGGIDKEEDRVKQTVDRVNTTATVWLGLTVQCAQCHSHKYDPISQRDYFRLYAFFNNSDEQDFELPPTELQQLRYERDMATHRRKLGERKAAYTQLRNGIRDELPQIVKQLLQDNPGGAVTPTRTGLIAHLPFEGAEDIRMRNTAADAVAASLEGPGSLETVPGKTGQALKLDGTGQHIVINETREFESDEPFTCAAWIHSEDAIGAIVTKIDEPRDFRGIDFTNNRGLLEVHIVDKWPQNALKVTPKTRVKPNEWHHVLMTYDGSKKASGVGIYVDGKSQPLDVHRDSLTGSIKTNHPWRVGRRRGGTFFKGLIDEVRIYDRVLNEHEIAIVAGESASLTEALKVAQIDPLARTAKQIEALIDHVVTTRKEAVALRNEITQIEKNPPKLQRGTGMGLVQRSTPRQTFVHLRGDFLKKGDEVAIGVPDFLNSFQQRGDSPDRLDLARWIASPDNPLTARVAVNRIWQHYFGRGLVQSDADFGTQGEPPSHPELLDWLASHFIQNGWSLKEIHRLILTSAAYRQSSVPRSDLAERDPYNVWLASQNRLRVEAETVRDLALATSGMLNPRIKGPSVFPPLPPGVIELAFVDVINRGPWKVSEGGDRFRRGLYTFFQRTSPYPMLQLFDAPDSNTTCTRRERSNTPLQALTLWNDPVFLDSARAAARRILSESTSSNVTTRVQFAFRLCLSRNPTNEETRDVESLFHDSEAIYERKPQLTEALTTSKPPEGISKASYAAWVTVTRTLMNVDEFITRE